MTASTDLLTVLTLLSLPVVHSRPVEFHVPLSTRLSCSQSGSTLFQTERHYNFYLVSFYISRYHGKCANAISLWVISYVPQFELAVKHFGINH